MKLVVLLTFQVEEHYPCTVRARLHRVFTRLLYRMEQIMSNLWVPLRGTEVMTCRLYRQHLPSSPMSLCVRHSVWHLRSPSSPAFTDFMGLQIMILTSILPSCLLTYFMGLQFVTLTIILPSCLMTYLGQAAYMLDHPEGYSNPYFNATPEWAFWPVLIIATLASIVSAQSLISGEPFGNQSQAQVVHSESWTTSSVFSLFAGEINSNYLVCVPFL